MTSTPVPQPTPKVRYMVEYIAVNPTPDCNLIYTGRCEITSTVHPLTSVAAFTALTSEIQRVMPADHGLGRPGIQQVTRLDTHPTGGAA